MMFTSEAFLLLITIFQCYYFTRIIANFNNNFPTVVAEAVSSTAFALICTILLLQKIKAEGHSLDHTFYTSNGYVYVKILIAAIAYCLLQLIRPSFILQKLNFAEFFVFYLASVLSLFMIISTQNLIAMYLAIELQSLCFYVLASYSRNSAFSVEAGLKYFLTGANFSAVLLLGIGFLYGSLGDVNLLNISAMLPVYIKVSGKFSIILLTLAFILITNTLLFKIACAPFHGWAPDVYDGAPLSATIVFSILPKIGVVFFFIKWFSALGVGLQVVLEPYLLTIGLISCFWGALVGLFQKTIKRLNIYSSISQIGFVIACISQGSVEAYASCLFFLSIYIITAILLWGHIVIFYFFQRETLISTPNPTDAGWRIQSLTSFVGLWQNNRVWSVSLMVILFSIAGVPPFAGFFAKLYAFAAVASNSCFVASLLIIVSCLPFLYYLRILKAALFEPVACRSAKNDFSHQAIFSNEYSRTLVFLLGLLLAFLVFLVFFHADYFLLCKFIVLTFFD